MKTNEQLEHDGKLEMSKNVYYGEKERLRENGRMLGVIYHKTKKIDEEITALKSELKLMDVVVSDIFDTEGVDVESDYLEAIEKERWRTILEEKAEYEAKLKLLESKKWLYNLATEKYKKEENTLRDREKDVKEEYFTLRNVIRQDKSEAASKFDMKDALLGMILIGMVILILACGFIVMQFTGIFDVEDLYINILLFVGIVLVLTSIILNIFEKK